MHTRLLAAALAAALLSSCSDSKTDSQSQTGPFDGKSAAEVAAFIAFGFEDGATGYPSWARRVGVKNATAKKLSDEPFRFTYTQTTGTDTQRIVTVTMTTADNCVFDVKAEKGDAVEDGPFGGTFRLDFSGLTALNVGEDSSQFDGAKLQCVSIDGGQYVDCERINKDAFSKGTWPTFLLYADSGVTRDEKTSSRAAYQGRVNQAIVYFRENICKPKG
ncbi:hypothetical protein [Rhizobium sp. KDH_Rht_773_N]